MPVRPLHISLGACLALGSALFAANPSVPNPRLTGTPFMRVWQAEDYGGTPSNRVVLQHPASGFIYAANGEGVLEFDGVRWRMIRVPRGGGAQLMVVDARGRIWFANDAAVGLLVPDERGELHATSALDRIPAGEPPIFPLGALSAGRDGVYIATRDRVLLFPSNGAPARIWRPAGEVFTQIWTMDGKLHIRAGPGVLALDDGEFRLVPGLRTFAFATRPDPAGGWQLVNRDGVRRWDNGYQALAPGRRGLESPLEGDFALCATFLDDGRIAFGTTRSGIVVSDRFGQREQVIDRARGLPSNRVEHLCTDREGGLWVALRTGVARVQLDSPFARHGTAQRRIDSTPHALALHRGQLYVGGGEGLSRRDPGGAFHPIEDVPLLVRGLVSQQDQLFATGLELRQIMPDDRARRLDATYFGLVPLSSAPGYFVHGNGDGVALDRFAGEKWETLARAEGISGATTVIREWPAGVVWAANHSTGVWRIDLRGALPELAGATLRAPLKNYGAREGLPRGLNQYNIDLFRLGTGLGAVADARLFRYDEAGDRFVPENRILGLPGEGGAAPAVRFAHTAADGTTWLQLPEPSLALVQLIPAGADRWRAAPPPGPTLPRMRLLALQSDPSARTLWLGAAGTLISHDLDWRPVSAASPLKTVVRRVDSADGTVLWADGKAPATLNLPPARTALRFIFAAPSFAADPLGRAHTRFRTRLEGLESAWTPWTTEAQRDFTNLPFRRFVFHVQAEDDSRRTSEAATFSFAIAAPWWLTRWAFAGYSLAGLALIAGLVRLRLAALRSRNKILEQTVTERTREIVRLRQLDIDEKLAARLGEEKARLEVLRYQLNPHFLYNSLNSIRALVSSSPKSAGNMVTQLSDFCRVTLTRPDEPGPVAEEFEMLRLYLQMEQTRWRDGLVVEIDLSPAASAWRIPPFLLLSLVENALKHGRQSTAGVLTLRLSARVEQEPGDHDVLVLEVANSGTWLEPGHSFAPSTGVGLDNLRQRLRRYYRDRHSFHFDNDGGWVRAEIRLSATARIADAAAAPVLAAIP